eukprot:1899520-Pleurochrysis_carterae.AAC.4
METLQTLVDGAHQKECYSFGLQECRWRPFAYCPTARASTAEIDQLSSKPVTSVNSRSARSTHNKRWPTAGLGCSTFELTIDPA